jgi:phosphoribosylformylglycinamidine synthase
VHLDRAPLKYAGLSATEIWISEAQERMVLAVPASNLEKLRAICAEEHVEMAVLGEFAPAAGSTADKPALALMFHGKEVGRLDVHFLHEGIPTPRREAVWKGSGAAQAGSGSDSGQSRARVAAPRAAGHGTPAVSVREALLKLLAHPNIASKHWIVRQYDHEVRGGTAIKPLVGPRGRGPGDASVIQPVAGSKRGVAISQGLQTGIGDPAAGGDPYLMVLAAIDECVRNLVCVGADPERIAILDNFCWPSCAKPENLGSLVRAAEGCYDGAMAYRTPFVSGKDSLNNQFTTKDGKTIEIPPTLLITGMGIVEDVAKCVTMDAKRAGNLIIMVGEPRPEMGGSHYQRMFGAAGEIDGAPRADLEIGPMTARAVARLIQAGRVFAAHDVSDGGVLAGIAEMLIAGSSERVKLGAQLDCVRHDMSAAVQYFGEAPGRYLLEVGASNECQAEVDRMLGDVPWVRMATLDETGRLGRRLPGTEFDVSVEELSAAWMGTLDW